MSHLRQGSNSSSRSSSPLVFVAASNTETDQWVKTWNQIIAQDLVESQITSIHAEASVEEACEALLSQDTSCLAIKSNDQSSFIGLFDYADVNAFLVLAATRHKSVGQVEYDNARAEKIIAAATAGHVPIHLVSNLSDKNPLEILPHDADLISLLAIFSRGTHRAIIKAPAPSPDFLGMVSDRRVLSWFAIQAHKDTSLMRYLSNPLSSLALPSLYLYSAVVAVTSVSSVLDAMTLMSDEGVSTVAVIDEDQHLLSAISVTDIAKIVVPSENSHILSTPVHQFVIRIKEAIGATDGADQYPVYSVLPSGTLMYTIQKLLATNSHRLFVTDDFLNSSCGTTTSLNSLSGILSTVDILSLFAVIANIPDVDPTRMQRHRRASSSSSSSPKSTPRDFVRSRSNSRTSKKRSPSDLKSSISSLEQFMKAP